MACYDPVEEASDTLVGSYCMYASLPRWCTIAKKNLFLLQNRGCHYTNAAQFYSDLAQIWKRRWTFNVFAHPPSNPTTRCQS